MAERRYKPTPENERLVQQFIESSKRAGYDPTFTNIIIKEVKSDKTGKVRERVAKAQKDVEAKLPPLVAPGKGKPKDDVAARRRAFQANAKKLRQKEMNDLYKEGFFDVLKFLGKEVVAPAAVGGGLGLAYKAAMKVPTVLRTVREATKAAKQLSGKAKPKQLSGKPKPKELPPGRRGPDAVDPDEIIPPKGPGTRVQRRPQKEPEIIDAEVVEPQKLLRGRRGLPGRKPAKQLPAPRGPRQLKAGKPKPSDLKPDARIGKLAQQKGAQLTKKRLEQIANEYANRGKLAKRPLTELEKIAESYIRKPNPTKLERLAEAYIKRKPKKRAPRLRSPQETIRKKTVIGELARAKGAQLTKKELERIANAYASRGKAAKRPLTRLEKLAEDYINKPTQSKLERIAEAYIKQPNKPSKAQLEKMAEAYIKGPFVQKLGLRDDISKALETFLKKEGITSGAQLRKQFAALSQKLKAMGKPARARELSRVLNLAGR